MGNYDGELQWFLWGHLFSGASIFSGIYFREIYFQEGVYSQVSAEDSHTVLCTFERFGEGGGYGGIPVVLVPSVGLDLYKA